MNIALDISAVTAGDIDFSDFSALGDVKLFENLSKKKLYELVADREAVVVNKVPVDRELLDRAPRLRYVGLFATGYNNVDTEECKKRGIAVCNVPDYSSSAVAQHVFALLLSFMDKIGDYTKSVSEGDWTRAEAFCYFPYPTSEIEGKRFGVVGYGNIGRRVARIADALGAQVLVNTRTTPRDCPFELLSLSDLLSSSDIVSLHCPLTDETRSIINSESLSAMKETAILVNTARGPLVDEEALARALNSGRIAGACLDTLCEEPMSCACPLLGAKNCLITPHMAWTARETRERLVKVAFKNLEAFSRGGLENSVL